jgi:Ca-activated chloride channel family protein
VAYDAEAELKQGATVPGEGTLGSAQGTGRLFALLGGSMSSDEDSLVESRRSVEVEEAAELVGESPEEITDLAPVEDLLALDVSSYKRPDDGYVYFRISIARRGEGVLPPLGKDVLLIQDCSESMTPAKLNNCKEGLHRWLDWLNEEDRFNLVGFREGTYMFDNEWQRADAGTKARARFFIEEMESRGKTDVYQSLQEVLGVVGSADRPVLGILITDGRPTLGTVDSSDIIEQFTQRNGGELAVFTVGGGRRVNRFLLDLLSYNNRGDAYVVRQRHDIPDALERLAQDLSRPVLTDLRFHFSGIADSEVYPQSLPHLFLDRSLVLYGRAPLGESLAFQVRGEAGVEEYDMVFYVDLAAAREGADDLRTHWAWHRIYDLIGDHIETRDDAVVEEIRRTAQRYGLVVPYAEHFGLQ